MTCLCSISQLDSPIRKVKLMTCLCSISNGIQPPIPIFFCIVPMLLWINLTLVIHIYVLASPWLLVILFSLFLRSNLMLYRIAMCRETSPMRPLPDWGVHRILQKEWRFWSQDHGSLPKCRTYGTEGVVRNWGGPFFAGHGVVNGLITPVNGLIPG